MFFIFSNKYTEASIIISVLQEEKRKHKFFQTQEIVTEANTILLVLSERESIKNKIQGAKKNENING